MAYIGIDGVHCTIVFKKQLTYIQQIDKNLKNSDGTTYGNVKTRGEHTKLRFNIPLMLRDTNMIPYGLSDKEQLPYIKTKLLIDLNNIFGDKIKAIIPNAIEINITKQLKEAKTHEIIKLLSLSFVEYDKQLLVWMTKGDDADYMKTTGMLSITKVNDYRLKVYDKSEQINQTSDYIAKGNILRFELIVQGRRIKKTYGNNCTLFDILENIEPLINVFKEKTNGEIKNKVKRFLAESKELMFEELTLGKKPIEVFGKYKNIIIDRKQMRLALKRYYEFKGAQDQSKALAKRLSDKFDVSSGVIREFNSLFE